MTLTIGSRPMFSVVDNDPRRGRAAEPVDATPRDLMDQLDDRLRSAPPGPGRVYAAALRTLVAVVDDAADRFADPAAPAAVTASMVRRFLAAESARDARRPDDVPLPWATALAVDPALPALRHLLVTANAGLNDDLVHALLDLPGWDGSAASADHGRWVELMADVFADAAFTPGAGALDRARAAQERPALRRALAAAGAQAWVNAAGLADHRSGHPRSGGDPDPRGRLLATLTTGNVGELLTRHRWPAPRWADILVVRLSPA